MKIHPVLTRLLKTPTCLSLIEVHSCLVRLIADARDWWNCRHASPSPMPSTDALVRSNNLVHRFPSPKHPSLLWAGSSSCTHLQGAGSCHHTTSSGSTNQKYSPSMSFFLTEAPNGFGNGLFVALFQASQGIPSSHPLRSHAPPSPDFTNQLFTDLLMRPGAWCPWHPSAIHAPRRRLPGVATPRSGRRPPRAP